MTRTLLVGTALLVVAALPIATRAQQSGTADRDRDFMMEAARGGMAEVELGRLAASTASDSRVEDFGNKMVTDHTKGNDELASLAQSKSITLPTDQDAKAKALHDRLSKLAGAEFDRAYIQAMVSDHQEDVAAFRKESQSGKDSDVKAWASKTLPTLEEHLKMAQDVNRSLAPVGTSGKKIDPGPTGTGTSGINVPGKQPPSTTTPRGGGPGPGTGAGTTGAPPR